MDNVCRAGGLDIPRAGFVQHGQPGEVLLGYFAVGSASEDAVLSAPGRELALGSGCRDPAADCFVAISVYFS